MIRQPDCPAEEELRSFAEGTIGEASITPLCEHIEHCATCESRLREIETHDSGFLEAVREARSAINEGQSSLEASLTRTESGEQDQAVRSASFVVQTALAKEAGDKDSPSMLEYVGKQFGPFRIRSILGSGGMGTVFRARHEMMGRDVALKIIHPSQTADPKRQRRFLREMIAAGQVDHENIVQALDANQIDGVHYLAMKYVIGKTVRELTAGGRRFPISMACEIARQVAIGLVHAHQAGLVHRDIKPSNVILTLDSDGKGQAKILDLGLARLDADEHNLSQTRLGSVLGTADYMSPEQADGIDVDARSDLYSLGVMLYRMLAGRLPYPVSSNASEAAVLASVLRDEPERLELSRPETVGPLADLVHLTLRKDPDQRLPDCREFAKRLETFAAPFTEIPENPPAGMPSAGSLPLTGSDATPSAQTQPASWIGWSLLALLIVGSAAFVVSRGAPEVTPTAERSGAETEGTADAGPASASPQPVDRGADAPAATSTQRLGNGYVATDYHPTAPQDGLLEIDFRGRPHDESDVTLHYEAPPGKYLLRLRPDDRGLLASNRMHLLFYFNGDQATFNTETNQYESSWLAKIPMPAPPELEVTIRPGTQKIGIVPAWNNDLVEKMGTRRIENTHTVCIFYAYPDLTYANAKISPSKTYAGMPFDVRFDVVNRGVCDSAPGVAYVRLDPVGSRARSIVGRFPYGALKPGESHTISESIDTSRFQVTQKYIATIEIDGQDSTIERDELAHGSWKQNLEKPFVPASDLENLVPYNNEFQLPVEVITAE